MFTAKEQKIILSTLNSRRAWYKKSIEDTSLADASKKEYAEAMKLLDSSIQKVSNISPLTPKAPVKEKEKRTTVTMANARFLIAEDNADSANLLQDILQDIGAKVIDLAKDGKEAFDFIKRAEEPYDIILCDWDMPELTGIEVHQKAKASNTLKNAHFVMVTATSEATRIKQAVKQGVNDYIVKPVDMNILEGKIKAALGIE